MTAGPDDPDGQVQQQGRPARGRWIIPLLIVVAAILAILGVLWTQTGPEPGSSGQEETSAQGSEQPEQRGAVEHPQEVAAPDLSSEESRDPDDLLAEGPVDAPVVMVVFTDFQCPYCAQWSHETLPAMREYVDRGELRIEWRDVNVYGDESEQAARASLAAAMQGQHEAYHEELFDGGEIRSSQELSEQSLIDLAAELGLDTGQFEQDLNSPEVAEVIDRNAQQGIDIGAMSTPAFIIGGTPTVGAQPTEEFTALVDEALAEAEG